MFRLSIHLLLVAGLLLCPMRCSAHVVAAPFASSNGCACCASPCDAPAPPSGAAAHETAAIVGAPSPDQPAEDECGCANCICNGAVTEPDAGGDDALFALDLLIEADHRDGASAALSSTTCAPGHRVVHPSGRAVRIAHQSLRN